MAKNDELTAERRDAIFAAMPEHARRYRERLEHWLASTEQLCASVAVGGTYEQQQLLIVRLAGIASDLRRRFDPPAVPPDSRRAAVKDAIAALCANLTDDELLWLELRRNEQCHPVIDDYRPKAEQTDQWNQRNSTILGKQQLGLDDLFQRCGALERAHDGFSGVAEVIAKKVLRDVSTLRAAMRTLLAGL